jgi:hypothetical protein
MKRDRKTKAQGRTGIIMLVSTRNALRDAKRGAETYDDLILRLLAAQVDAYILKTAREGGRG